MSKSAKGSSFEREICKQLSLWWTDNERDDVFWRTSGSGARATTRRKNNIRTKYEYGDVAFTDPIGQPLMDAFLIELKRGYSNDISILDLLDKSDGLKDTLLLQWWKKAEEERGFAERKHSLIIFRRNRREACIFMTRCLYNLLADQSGDFEGSNITWRPAQKVFEKQYFEILLLKDFLEWANQESIKNILLY